ncbi:CgeB family protein [Sulfurimonas marina]|uniref:CgeB family protein n=1 Tax=Sulfurimonas marina TaxID=2590551 RepID=UPI001D05AA4A|nr:glycosyltransferase [Sulfurimonas marina]
MIKKILFIGLKYSYGKKELGEALNKKAHSDMLKEIGYEVENIWLDDYETNEKLQEAILNKAHDYNPDMIFFKIFKFEVQFETLQTLKKEFFLVNWFGDDQWRFETFTSKYAPYFDVCITTDKFSIEKYKAIGQNNVIRSQHASFENFNDFENIEYKYDVSFIGGANLFRKWFVDELKKKGIIVECFGSGWLNGRITYEQMNDIMLKSKINLNISNSISYDIRYLLHHPKNILSFFKSLIRSGSKNISQTKARIFEIPVRGGFEITEYVPSLEDYFDIGKNIVCYSSVDEAALLIKYYLNNDKERENIRTLSVEKKQELSIHISKEQ